MCTAQVRSGGREKIQVAAIQEALLAWFEANQRQLPWRTAPSLYKTVVSEFMLQQTQVDTALPYFERWLRLWPDFTSLATATEDEVVKAWEGLGYYNRARNLRKLAECLAAMPELPSTAAAWQTMPGVGPYTAAAISSIACGTQDAVVDGNVVRVLSRLTADARLFSDNGAAVKAIAPLARILLYEKNPGAHNQAVMELGALVCRRQNPLCTVCPLVSYCAGAASPETFPKFVPRVVEKLFLNRILVLHEGKILLQRHAAASRRLSGLHELPLAASGMETRLKAGILLGTKRRAISNQSIEEKIFRVNWDLGLEAAIQSEITHTLVWVPLENLADITLSGPHRKWITQLLQNRNRVLPG
ncbi:MAG: A/G-specific adenine glycosylase [Puniceicoccales bacterium]|nr:A/G-specific adenine glycosylase [Puniceicoccales bacterium]